MAKSIFMTVDGIPGGSTDKDDAVDLDNVSWGASNSGGMTVTREKGQVNLSEVTISMLNDVASTGLIQKCCDGGVIKSVVFDFVEAGREGAKKEYYKITLSDVVVSSYSMSKSEGMEIQENFSFSYATIEINNDINDAGKMFTWDVPKDIKL